MKLAGQVAVVTGAGRGIGRAVAVRLAREGAAVALAARSASELDGAAREIAQAGGRALAVPTDVRQEAAVEALARRALAEWGRVDVLVNAAGLATFAPVTDSKLDDWDQMLAVNLRGAVLCCRAVLPAMIAQHRGTIINVGSVVTGRHPVTRPAAPRQAPQPSAILSPQSDPPRLRGNQGGTNADVD